MGPWSSYLCVPWLNHMWGAGRASLPRALLSLPEHLRHWLHWVSGHTGVPAVCVAAVAIVLSFRIARRVARLVLEVALVLALLLVATKLGWIHW